MGRLISLMVLCIVYTVFVISLSGFTAAVEQNPLVPTSVKNINVTQRSFQETKSTLDSSEAIKTLGVNADSAPKTTHSEKGTITKNTGFGENSKSMNVGSGEVNEQASTINDKRPDQFDTMHDPSMINQNNTEIDIANKITDTPYKIKNVTNVNKSEYTLPDSWKNFCNISGEETYESEFTKRIKLTVIKCQVTAEYSGHWTLADLREYLKKLNTSDMKFSVEIECSDKSNVSLPWPAKAGSNLYKLTVRHCLLTDYLKEHNSSSLTIYPDSLRFFELISSTVLISVKQFANMLKNGRHLQQPFSCFHAATVETLIQRGISYQFKFDFVIDNMLELGEKFMADVKRIPYKCDYRHLLHLDEGQSDSMSVYQTSLNTDGAIFDQLRTYNLSFTYLKSLGEAQLKWSKYFPKLQTYDLSHNDISKISRFELPLHTRKDRVTTVNLQFNNITRLTVEDLARFKQMDAVFIDLRNNPITCECVDKTKELIQYVKEDRHKSISNVSDYSYVKELKCARPERLKGQTLGSLADSGSLCVPVEKEYFIVPVMILSGSLVILSVVIFVLLRFRQEVQVVLFTRFNIIIPCQTRENHDKSKKYDAFVSYSSNEGDWVEPLFEGLEKASQEKMDQPFKFCLHHRDFIPGRTIFDNVIKSVESSRHTIILLSNHFLKSEYCLYEFQEAFRQSIMEQRRHLVIVMVEDINETLLPRDLKRCINTFTYIRRDDYLFNQRLVYALSIKQKDKIVSQNNSKSKISSEIKSKGKSLKMMSPSKSNQHCINAESSSNREKETVLSIPHCTKDNKMNSKYGRDSSNFNQNIRCVNSETKNNKVKETNKNMNNDSEKYKIDSKHDKQQSHEYKDITNDRNDGKSIDKHVNTESDNNTVNFKDKSEAKINIGNIRSEQNKVSKKERENYGLNDEIRSDNLTKLMIDYDRSMSTASYDTGYGSDRTDKLSPDICSLKFDDSNDAVVCIV